MIQIAYLNGLGSKADLFFNISKKDFPETI